MSNRILHSKNSNIRQRAQTYANVNDGEHNGMSNNNNGSHAWSSKPLQRHSTVSENGQRYRTSNSDPALTRHEQTLLANKRREFLEISQRRILDQEKIFKALSNINKESAMSKLRRKISVTISNNGLRQYENAISDSCPWLSHPLNNSKVPLEFPDNCSDVEHFLKTRFSRRTAVSLDSLTLKFK